MKNGNKLNHLAVLTIIFVILFCCFACNQNSFVRYGSLYISIDNSVPKTVSPALDNLEFSYYIIYGTHLNGDTFEKQIDSKESYIDNLREGQWSFHVEGFNSNGLKIGTSDDEIVVIAPEENSKVFFAMHYLTEGTGYLKFSIAVPEGDTTIAYLVVGVRDTNGFNIPYLSGTYQEHFYERSEAIDTEDGYSVFTASIPLSVGNREVLFAIVDENEDLLSPVLQEIVQIHDQLTSSMSYIWLKEFIPAVSEPVFSLNSNSTDTAYTDGTELVITPTYSESSIYYTVDGTIPTENSSLYTGPITLDRNMWVRAIAMKDGLVSSSIVSRYYYVKTQTPIISVVSDSASNSTAQYLVLSSGTEDAVLHYTTDGSDATVYSPVYTERLLIDHNNAYNNGSTVKVSVYAEKPGLVSSSNAKEITIKPSGGINYTDPSPIRTLSITMPDYSFGFNSIGSGDSINVVAKLKDTSGENLSGVQYDWLLDNEPISSDYYSGGTLRLGPRNSTNALFIEADKAHILSVRCSVDGIRYTANQTIKTKLSVPVVSFYEDNGVFYLALISSDNCKIHYRTDGYSATTSDVLYNEPISLANKSSISISAIAEKEGYSNSSITSGTYYKVSISYAKSPGSSNISTTDFYKQNTIINLDELDIVPYNDDNELVWSDTYGYIVTNNVIKVTSSKSYYGSWKTYSVGNIGPSGGYIFYDKGSYSDGWRYLEAAPSDLNNNTYCFGYYKTSPSTTSAINCSASNSGVGYGLTNTNNLVSYMGTTKGYPYTSTSYSAITDYAARMCSEYSMTSTVNGKVYDDWFLPSLNELGQMYNNLKYNGLGSFRSSSYWSSTEYSGTSAYYVNFNNTSSSYSSSYTSRSSTYYVRPVRRF